MADSFPLVASLLVIVVLVHGHDDVILTGSLKGEAAMVFSREHDMINITFVL
jgi:hypothetical protein